jgi:hypothetical protein
MSALATTDPNIAQGATFTQVRDANGTRYRVGLDTSGVLTVTTL